MRRTLVRTIYFSSYLPPTFFTLWSPCAPHTLSYPACLTSNSVNPPCISTGLVRAFHANTFFGHGWLASFLSSCGHTQSLYRLTHIFLRFITLYWPVALIFFRQRLTLACERKLSLFYIIFLHSRHTLAACFDFVPPSPLFVILHRCRPLTVLRYLLTLQPHSLIHCSPFPKRSILCSYLCRELIPRSGFHLSSPAIFDPASRLRASFAVTSCCDFSPPPSVIHLLGHSWISWVLFALDTFFLSRQVVHVDTLSLHFLTPVPHFHMCTSPLSHPPPHAQLHSFLLSSLAMPCLSSSGSCLTICHLSRTNHRFGIRQTTHVLYASPFALYRMTFPSRTQSFFHNPYGCPPLL